MVGELVTDATAIPGTNVFNAPVVWTGQYEIGYEFAIPPNISVITGGDPDPPTVTAARTGNRTNYMQYGGASGTDPTGSSSISGALVSGL